MKRNKLNCCSRVCSHVPSTVVCKHHFARASVFPSILLVTLILTVWAAPRTNAQSTPFRTVDVAVPFDMMAPWFTLDGELEDEVRLQGTLHVTTKTWAATPGHIDRFSLHANAVDIHGTSETTGQRFRLNGSFSFDLRDPDVTFNPDGSFNVPMQPWKLRLHKVDPEPARLTSDLFGSTGATATPPNIPAPITIPCQRILSPEGTPTPAVNCGSLKYTSFYTQTPSIYRVLVANGTSCLPGVTCVVPDGATIFNGFTGGYKPPLRGQMRIYTGNVPWGAGGQGAYSVNWRCRTGNQEAPTGTISFNGLFTGSCLPIYSATESIQVWAESRFRFFDRIGFSDVYQEITAVVTEKVFTFHMDQRPVDLPPVVQGITVRAAARVADRCPIGTECVLNDGDILFDGQVGDYGPGISMQMSASDPEGDPIIVEWFCRSGLSFFNTITNQGSLNAGCNPAYTWPDPVQVYARVSDGNNEVWVLPPREFYMLHP